MSAKRGAGGVELGTARRGSPRWILVLLALAVGAATLPVSGMTELKIHFTDSDPVAGAAVTLVAPDGGARTLEDEDGDGWIVVSPDGPAGSYRVTISRGEASVTRTVTLLEGGAVTLVYAGPDDVEIRYSGRLRAAEEIIVTARKREESLQTIPISIAAFTAEALEARSMRDLRDVGDFTPNVDFSVSNGIGGATSEATVHIRGIGQLETALFADPGVGIYVDGVYLARAGGSVLDLLDVERVEILRGPQGTLFGKNTTGGAISLITRKPGPDKLFEVELAAGELDRLDGRATADFQLSESVFATLAAAATNRDGFTESLATGRRFGDDNRDSVRAALRWLASGSTVVDFSTEFMRERETAANESLLSLVPTPLIDFYNAAVSGAGLTPVGEAFITGDARRSYSTAESRNLGDVAGATVTVSWTSGAVDLTSISAYREIEFDVSNDGDGTPQPLAERSFLQTQNQLSQEVHVGGLGFDDRLRWLLGGLYFTESSEEDSLTLVLGGLFEALEAAPGPIFAPPGVPDLLCSPGPPPPGLPCFGGAGNPLNLVWFVGPGDFERIGLSTDSWALFGEGTYSVNDKLAATFGLRYTLEQKELGFFRVPGSGGPPTDLFNEDDWDAFSPRLSLAYQASDDVLLYASAARGFKSGGFNGRPQMREALDPYGPEKVWAYELGWKSDLSGDRLRLNGAAFYSDYTDIQFSASLNIEGDPVFVLQNAGQAEVKGFEIELSARPSRVLDLEAAVGYIDTRYTELEDVAPNSVTLDGVFPKTPEWTLTLSPQYAFALTGDGTLTLRADYSYRSEFFNDIQNSPQILQDGYGLLNARLGWASRSEAWEIALFGTNLGDRHYLGHGFNPAAFGAAVGTAGRPREWGLSVRRRWR